MVVVVMRTIDHHVESSHMQTLLEMAQENGLAGSMQGEINVHPTSLPVVLYLVRSSE